MSLFNKKGNEYNKAKGAWNLITIPGVTNRQGQENLKPISNWRGYCSKYNFAGAATSSSKNAVAGYIHEKMNASSKMNVNDKSGLNDPNPIIYDVRAHKSYFFMGDYMLALGAGVSNLNTSLEGDIWTTIDQTYWSDQINWGGTRKKGSISKTKKTFQKKLNNKKEDIVWVQQLNGFAYGILNKYTDGEIILNAEKRKSKWTKLHPKNKKKKNLPQEIPVFQLSINHGKNIQNGKYAYFVYLENEFTTKKMSDPDLQILSNTTSLQAAATKDEKVITAVFFDTKSELNTKRGKIKVSAPAIILAEEHETHWSIAITDPTMDPKLTSIDVYATIAFKNEKENSSKEWKKITIQLPKGKDLGKPTILKINKN